MSVVSRPRSLTLMYCSYYVNHTSCCALAELMLTFYPPPRGIVKQKYKSKTKKKKQERGQKTKLEIVVRPAGFRY